LRRAGRRLLRSDRDDCCYRENDDEGVGFHVSRPSHATCACFADGTFSHLPLFAELRTASVT
jgi:hypothetical protein